MTIFLSGSSSAKCDRLVSLFRTLLARLVFFAPIFLYAALMTGCQNIDGFVNQSMCENTNIDYAEEGRIFVLKNGCYDLATDYDYLTNSSYLRCTLASGAYEPPWPSTPGEPDVEVLEFAPENWRLAVPYVESYRWITVNPMFTSIKAAVSLASTQLKIMHRKGLVLVYLPQGPDRTQVNYDSWESREHEAYRFLCGGFQVDHPVFQSTLGALVDSVTNRHYERPSDELVVTAYSYSGPQTLDVIKDNERVFFVNVAPNFGWAQWYGNPEHELNRRSCNPWSNNSVHRMTNPNPHVANYVRNQAFARVPQCLVASRDDCVSIGFKGSVFTQPEIVPRDTNYCNDPAPVRLAEWQAGYFFGTMTPTEFCANARPGYRGLKEYIGPIGGDMFLNDYAWRWPGHVTEQCFAVASHLVSDKPRPFSAPTLDRSHEFPGLHGGHLLRAFQANAQTVGTLKLLTPRTPTADDDLSYNRSVTTVFGEENYYGHSGYWLNGTLPPCDDEDYLPEEISPEWYHGNLNFHSVMQECVDLFDTDGCPACRAAEDWAQGRPQPTLTVSYREVTAPPLERVWFGGPVKSEDIIYVPNRDLTHTQLYEAYERLIQRHDCAGSDYTNPCNNDLHISADSAGVDLQFELMTPDIAADDPAALLSLLEIQSVRPQPTELSDAIYVYGPHIPGTDGLYFISTWDGGVASDPYYDGTIGAWVDLYTRRVFNSSTGMHDTGPLPLARVLYMKTDPNSQGVLPASIPDIRNFSTGSRTIMADERTQTLRWNGFFKRFETVPRGGDNGISSVLVQDVTTAWPIDIPTVQEREWPNGCTVATSDPLSGPACWTMQYNEYRSDWDVHASWCNRFPRDQEMCPGSLLTCDDPRTQCPNSHNFRIRITAYNRDSPIQHFFREYSVEVMRTTDP